MALSAWKRRGAQARIAALIVVTMSAGGCASARTEVIVSVDTDIASLDTLVLDVTDPGGTTRSSRAPLGAGQPAPPRTLGLVWNGGAYGPFVVRAVGLSGGTQTIERVADFGFQRGRTLVLHVDLLGRCTGVSCPGGETCGESGCRSTTVGPSELEPYTSTSPADGGLPRDGGCAPETCNGGDDDCDGRTDEGFDLMTDESNCGRCGMRCRGAADTCCSGVCAGAC